MTTVAELPKKFAARVISAQSIFRAVMEAMARPGSLHRVVADGASASPAPAPMMPAAAAVALTLFDHDTPIWLDATLADAREVGKWLKFHTGAPIVDEPSVASFALIGDGAALPPLEHFAFGSTDYPDRSTTLIVQVESLTEGPGVTLRGPGIDGEVALRASLEPRDLFARLAVNEALFPRGIDVMLVAGDALVAIPRTTRFTGAEQR